MLRIKYLLGILSASAALLYGGFGFLSLNATSLSTFDRVMPFALCSLHTLVAMVLFSSSYAEHKREEIRMKEVIRKITLRQSSFRAEDLALAAGISLAEAHEYLLKPATQKTLLAVTRHEHIVVRAFPRHSLN